jgi:tRNA (guanine37-N1)-methyltransferase
MNFTVLTLFPEMFSALLVGGMIKRAVESNRISIETVDIRDFAKGPHRTVDDRPYGGGSGMVMKPEPLAEAIRDAKQRHPGAYTLVLTPQGRLFDHGLARELSGCAELILVCGRYEGLDDRICQDLADEELSIGDYVLTGGEFPARWEMNSPLKRTPFQQDCWNTLNTHDPGLLRGSRCLTSCSLGTMALLGSGGDRLRWFGHFSKGLICC